MVSPVAPDWVRWWFCGAALYGTATLLPLSARTPPPTDALFFYAFVGTALAFQLAFWIIGTDPVRHRPLMPAAMLEKLAFVVPVAVLASAQGLGATTIAAGMIDLVLGVGFLVAWRTMRRT